MFHHTTETMLDENTDYLTQSASTTVGLFEFKYTHIPKRLLTGSSKALFLIVSIYSGSWKVILMVPMKMIQMSRLFRHLPTLLLLLRETELVGLVCPNQPLWPVSVL